MDRSSLSGDDGRRHLFTIGNCCRSTSSRATGIWL